jgi:translocation and assembly module TamB
MKARQIVARIVIGLLVVVVIVTLASVLLLRSRSFQPYLLSRVEEAAGAALHTQVHIDGLELQLSDLAADLRGVTIRSSATNHPEPLLYVPHMALTFKIISVLRLEWNLSSITIHHPVVHVFTDEKDETNTPTAQNSGSLPDRIFDLAVHHAVIDGGDIYYNDIKRSLTADVHNLQFQARHDSGAGGRYYGKLEYQRGSLRFGSLNAIPHDLRASFSATRRELVLDPLVLSSGPSRLQLAASLQNFDSPRLTGQYNASLVASDFRRVLNNPILPSGTITAAGTVKYQYAAGRPAIESIALAGDMSSAVLNVQSPRFRGVVRNLYARYTIADDNAFVSEMRARLLGGMLDGKLSIHNLSGKAQSHMQARLRGISLSELELLAPAQAVKEIKLTGEMEGTLDARWVRSLQDLVAKLDASVVGEANKGEANKGEANAKGTASTTTVPVEGAIHGGYVATKKEVTLSNSFVRTPQTSIRANGTVGHQSSLQLSIQSDDLREVETIAAILSIPGDQIHSMDLSGAASFAGEVRGTTTSPTISGQLTGTNVQVRGTSWRAVRANLQAGPSEVVLQHGHLEPAGQGRIDFSGQASLMHWTYAPEDPFALTIRASQLSAADLARLAETKIRVSGALDANIQLHGSQLNPVGQGHVVLVKASVSGEEVQRADLEFRGTGDSVNGTLDLRLPAGDVRGELTYYPKQQGYTATLQATNLQLDRFNRNRVEKLGIAGALSLQVNGTGTVKDPALEATMTVPQLRIQDRHLREVRLQASVKNHVATVELNSEAARTGLRAGGTVMLQDPYNADIKVDTGAIPLHTLAAIYLPGRAADVTGQAEFHAALKGPLKDSQLLQAHASIPVLTAKYKSYELSAVNPIQIDYKDGALEIQRTEIRGPDTNLEFQGSIPTNQHSPATVRLRGSVSLNLLRALDPGIRSAGALEINIHSFGSMAAPGLQGEIRIVNATVLADGAPLGLRNGNGLLKLNNNRIAIDSFHAEVGGGTVTARGGVALTPQAQFDLAFSGTGIQLLYPEGVRSAVDANLTLSGNMQTAYLRGQAKVDRLSLTSDFDASRVADALSESTATPSSSLANRIHLGVSLQTTSEVNLSGRTLSLRGGANLQVQGTLAEPVILGRVNITGGDVIFLSNRYEMTGGTVEFANPTRTEPVLNLGATTAINEYNISVRLEGPLDRLRTTYSADPSLPPVDIINLLAFGKTTESGTASASQFGGLGAESVLASGISSQVTGRVQRLAGISQLSVDPILGSEQGDAGARIAVRQRVASNLFVAYSADVTSTLRQVIQVRYQLSPRWSISADVDQNGGFGFDARVHKEF